MGFLIRVMIFVGLVILFIPADEAETQKLVHGRAVSTLEAIGFASAVYDDARGFCGRNKEACDIGSVAAATFGAKARTGARWIYGYFEPGTAARPTAAHAAPADGQPMPPPLSEATGSIHHPGIEAGHDVHRALPAAPPGRPS